MTFALWAVALVAGLHLVHAYGGYVWVLRAIAAVRGRSSMAERAWTASENPVAMTVYIGAKDEAEIIQDRLENVIDTSYPLGLLEIIVVADGCSDATAQIAYTFAAEHPEVTVEVVEFEESQGKWAAQNLAALQGRGEVLVSTDAETVFVHDTLAKLAAPFADATVGVVGARVVYLAGDQLGSDLGTATAYSAYRNVEHEIRRYEMANGVLMKSDGPCVAYRKSIWQQIEPFEDVDHVVCYFARFAGLESIYEPNAIAYDRANESPRQDIHQRSRMTRKFFLTHWKRWSWRLWISDPAFSLAIYSHRTARLLSPLWLLILAAAGAAALTSSGAVAALVILVFVAAIGVAAILTHPRTRGYLVSFLAAQVGFARGIAQATFRRDLTGRYTPTRRVA